MATDNWNAAITAFSRQVANLDQLSDLVAKSMAKEIEKDLQKKYAAGRDPYGKSWKARKKSYPWPIMRRTGKLYDSLDVDVNGGKVIVTRGRGAKYGAFHQRGAGKLPVRLIVPINAQGIPTSWNPIFQAAFKANIKKLFK